METLRLRTINEILQQSKVIAVVGLSPREERDSHRVAAYLQKQGYRIIPVNPITDEILGERCYASVVDIPDEVDIVDIFRRSEDVPQIVDETIRKGVGVIWMQMGIVNEHAAKKAKERGIEVTMDRCMLVEHEYWKDGATD
jgi:predicted CoA-binding protein